MIHAQDGPNLPGCWRIVIPQISVLLDFDKDVIPTAQPHLSELQSAMMLAIGTIFSFLLSADQVQVVQKYLLPEVLRPSSLIDYSGQSADVK